MAALIQFRKFEGLGNDYLFIEDWDNSLKDKVDLPQLARKISNRNFGIGGDGIILLQLHKEDNSHLRMRMFNSDGSEAEMCGNGVRSFSKLVFDNSFKTKCKQLKLNFSQYYSDDDTVLFITTGAGIIKTKVIATRTKDPHYTLLANAGQKRETEATLIQVDMGQPSFSASLSETLEIANSNTEFDGKSYNFTYVSMGNPHCIIFVNDFNFNYRKLGKLIENHPRFSPSKTNVEFIQIVSPSEMNFRVWERGSGETLACGTGACAAVVAGTVHQKLKEGEKVTVHLKGGDLTIEWNEDTRNVYMTGPSNFVCEGTYYYRPQ